MFCMGVTEIVENIGSEITIRVVDLYNLLTVSEDKTVLFLIATVILAFYCYVVLLFYRKLSKRDMFEIHLEDKHGLGKIFEILAYVVRYLVLFPTYTIFWFVFLSYTIIFLGGADFTHILFLSAIVLSATRVLAYFNETAAGEIAKLLPFVFLSAVLLNPIILEQQAFPPDEVIREQLVPQAVSYFKIIVGLEIGLRVLYDLSLLLPRKKWGGESGETQEEKPKKKGK
jgi:hypothetical protein